MNRRAFSINTLLTLTGIAFIDTLFTQLLLASSAKTAVNRWLKELHIMCADLKTNAIPPHSMVAENKRISSQATGAGRKILRAKK